MRTVACTRIQPDVFDLYRSLAGIRCPCDKSALVAGAVDHGAAEEVFEALKTLPDKTYIGLGRVQAVLSLY